MSKFKELFNADISRYGGKPGIYIRVFHFLYRKASTSSTLPFRLIYKILYYLWANTRGLEIAANMRVGGGNLYWTCL